MLDWRTFETEAEEALFRQIQSEELCDRVECADYSDANCNCMAELNRRLLKQATGED